MGQKKLRIPVLVMIILGLLVGGPMPTYAQETSSNSAATLADAQQTLNVALFAENGGVTLTWRGDEATAAALSTMPTVRYGNYDLPMRLIPMQANGDVQPVIQELESIAWTGDVPGAQAMAPTAIDWENIPFLLTPSDETALPNAPITIFSTSRITYVSTQPYTAVNPTLASCLTNSNAAALGIRAGTGVAFDSAA